MAHTADPIDRPNRHLFERPEIFTSRECFGDRDPRYFWSSKKMLLFFFFPALKENDQDLLTAILGSPETRRRVAFTHAFVY